MISFLSPHGNKNSSSKKRSNNRLTFLLLFLVCLVLSGCKSELYSNLDEHEANQMMAALLSRDIFSDKLAGKENKWTVRVKSSDIPQALNILLAEGLPRQQFENMGQIFKKKGLISSPLEERVRYIYGLSQNLSDTITHIDGVLVAKVHIVLPENDPFSKIELPSSASVFIKCQNIDIINANIPRIKQLVVNSIEGLSYDKVTIVPFVQYRTKLRSGSKKFTSILGIKVAHSSAAQLKMVLGGLLISVIGLIVLAGFVFSFSRKARKKDTV